MDISGQIALITGGASGMGAETARHLAKLGAKVAVVDFNLEGAEEVAKEINGKAFHCDVSDDASVQSAFEAVKSELGVPRIVVNCAGVCPGSRVVGREAPHDLELFSKTLSVNLIGSFNVLRLTASAMSTEEVLNEDNERGIIINTASVAAYDGQIGQAAYAASKGGLVSMTLPIARELAQFGVRVLTVAPGLMETPMLAGMSDKVRDSLIATTIFPKRLGKACEFAHLIQHICENTLLNGEVIRLDGSVRLAPK